MSTLTIGIGWLIAGIALVWFAAHTMHKFRAFGFVLLGVGILGAAGGLAVVRGDAGHHAITLTAIGQANAGVLTKVDTITKTDAELRRDAVLAAQNDAVRKWRRF
ncbi:MAG TPA: hypothetical protein VNT30_21765 [Stellaceae bacterium]|nr:hypothetical protein [Stellaceae bacterium]